MNEEAIKLLYDDIKSTYDVGSLDDFKNYLLDDNKRQLFFDQVIKTEYDVNTIENFESVYGLKKKDELQPTSQEVVTESIIKEEEPTTLLESSEKTTEFEEVLDYSEEKALPYFRKELESKAFSIEDTGIGNALLVTDNITGEQTEIDLKPIEFFGASKEEQIQKIKKLQSVNPDPKRRLLSVNKFDIYKESVNNNDIENDPFVSQLKNTYTNFDFNLDYDPVRNGKVLTVSKGDVSTTFELQNFNEPLEKKFASINKFIYDNINDDEAIKSLSDYGIKILEEKNKRIKEEEEKTIDISDDAVNSDLYNEEYFSRLFNYLESNDISIPQEAKNQLKPGGRIQQYYVGSASGPRLVTKSVPYTKEEILSLKEQYFGNNPDVLNAISYFDKFERLNIIKNRVDRSKKLAKERVLENSTDRESFAEIVDQKYEGLSGRKKEIAVNLEIAKKDYKLFKDEVVKKRLEEIASKNPEVKIQLFEDEKTGRITGLNFSEPLDELKTLKQDIIFQNKSLIDLAQKSDSELAKIDSSLENVNEWREATKKNYSIVDNALMDLKSASADLVGNILIVKTLAQEGFQDLTGIQTTYLMPPQVERDAIRGEMAEIRKEKDDYFESVRNYQEAIKEGSFGTFFARQLATQTPNITLAIGTGAVGNAIGLSRGTISTLVSTGFGVSSAGAKYDEITTRQEFAEKAQKALNDLENVRDFLSEEDYFNQKYELERASKDLDITSTDKTLSVVGAGLTEFGVSRFIGTVPNSLKVLKDIRKSGQFIDDLYRSNFKAVKDSGLELLKRTGGGIVEETSIETLNKLNNYIFLGDKIDFSDLDDVTVTAIITEGSMNTPGLAYSTLLSQSNINKYKSRVKGIVSNITNLKESLKDPEMNNGVRDIIHREITDNIKELAGVTTELEGDALLLGAKNLKDLIMLSSMEKSLLDKAGVEVDDNYDQANAKVKAYIDTLDKDEANKYTDKLNFIDQKRKNIVSDLDYTNAVEEVFGEKGTKIAEGLDDKLTPQQKYVEVYKQIRQEINDNAKKEYDAIQEQETRDIPDAERAEGVQEMEAEVREPDVKETEEVAITPETSSNYANMTEDGEGNFVFYHVGQEGYSTIEPRTGDTKATSAAERSALTKVGGLAMYYTSPETRETAVSGKARYQVKVPVEKVYDFNNDPLNFNEEGKKRHSEENPGKAYDNNTSLAYVTKIAGENGFDMVVADWNGETRAQTTKALSPIDLEIRDGNTITKKFDNEYESNSKKGFESVVPESKQSKFNNLYNEIYKERNKDNKYDDLYFLSEKKGDYTQEQITELINTSDISQEIKDKYNSILESKEGKRRSKKKSIKDDYASKEVDRVKALPKKSEDGSTMNLDGSKYEDGGLVIPVSSVNMKASDLTTEAIENFIQENSESIGADNVKVGIYKFPNSDMVSIDINIVADRSMREEALKIGKELGQESLFDLDTFENIKTGADGKNPKKLSPEEFLDIQERLKVKTDGVSKLRDMFGRKSAGVMRVNTVTEKLAIEQQADKARQAIAKRYPDMKVEVFYNEADYHRAIGEADQSKGTYFNNKIYINLTRATETTVAHEVFHGILSSELKNNAQVQALMKRFVESLSRSQDPALVAIFAGEVAKVEQYKDVQNEEIMAELFGTLAGEGLKLKSETKSLIKRFLDKLAKMFGLRKFTDSEVIDVLNTLAGKVALGEAITESDVSIISSVDQGSLFQNAYLGTPANVIQTKTKRKSLLSTNIRESDLVDTAELAGKPLEVVYYDNFTSEKYVLRNRVSGSTVTKNGEGGPGYSYRKNIRNKGIIGAFTTVTKGLNLIQGIRSRNSIAKEDAVVGVALQNKDTGHLGNKTTLRDFYHPQEGVISKAVQDGVISNKNAVDILKSAVDSYGSLAVGIKKPLGFDSESFNSIEEFYNLMNNLSFELRGTFNSATIPSKQNLKITKATKPYVKDWLDSGVPTLSEYNEATAEPYTKNAKSHDIVKYLSPKLSVIGVDSSVEVSDVEADRAEKMGVKIVKIDDNVSHTSYPVVLFGKNVGIPKSFHSLRDMAPEWNVPNPFFKAGRRKDKAEPVRIPEELSSDRKPRVSKAKKQVAGRPSIDEVRRYAKENGISNSDSNSYLKELGYTQDEIASFIEKDEEIYVKKGNKVVDWLRKTKRYLLSAKGFLPKNVFIAKEKKDQLISAEISIAERTAKRLNKLLKNQSEEVLNEVNNLMNGKKFKLPREIALAAKEMREHIDSLSIKLVESGAVKSSESIENIKNNLGSYLNRSYRVFDDKNWASKVSEEVTQEAKQYLKNSWYSQESKLKMAEELSEKQGIPLDEWINQKVDQEVNDIVKQKEANSFIVAATEGSKNLKVLKQRKEIPAEIRALMGEYNDPAYNYVVSVAKIINIVENQNFLEKIKDIGDGVFLFKEGEIRRGDDTRYVKVAAESNESLAPLNGYYMPKEIVEELKNQDLITLKDAWFKKIYTGWLKSVAAVKKSKTIYSIGTHGKNVFGNARFMAQNGYLNPSDYNNAFKVLKNQFKGATDTELNELLDSYKKLGIINQSVNLNEIKSMFSGNDSFDIRIQKRMLEQTENKTYKNAKQKLKNIDKFLEDMYQAEDDLFKIVAYENEKRDYSDILYDKKYEELTETEKQNVDDYVSNIVKNILPNYSRIGNLGKGLKFIPVTGTFISFQIEAYRTAYNTLGLAINEIKSDNAKMRTKGAKRLVALMAVEGLKQSLLYFLGASFLGDDDEEEKVSANDVRPFLPEWAKNSDIIVTSLGDGKFSYVNVSASDPYGGILQILNAAARGEDMSESIVGALTEFGDPVLSQDIFLSAIDDIVRNKTQYGGDLIEAGDDIFDKTGKWSERLWTAFEPGTLTSIRKIMKSKEGVAYETIGQFTGLKPHTVDVKKILSFKLKDLKEDISEIKKEEYRAEYKVIDTGETGDLFEAYKNVDKKLEPVFEDANKTVRKAMRLGVSIYDIDNILTQKRFSNDDASMILFYDNLK